MHPISPNQHSQPPVKPITYTDVFVRGYDRASPASPTPTSSPPDKIERTGRCRVVRVSVLIGGRSLAVLGVVELIDHLFGASVSFSGWGSLVFECDWVAIIRVSKEESQMRPVSPSPILSSSPALPSNPLTNRSSTLPATRLSLCLSKFPCGPCTQRGSEAHCVEYQRIQPEGLT